MSGLGQDVGEQRRHVDFRPDAVGVRPVGHRHAAEIVGNADADADQPVDIDGLAGDDPGHLLAEEGDDLLRHGEVDLAADARPHIAEKVQRHDGDMVAVDIEADRKGAVGIDHQLGGRLAAPAQLPSGLQDHAVVEQALGDVGDGRRRQAGQVGDFGAGDRRAGRAHGLQGHALVVVAGAFQIGPRQRIAKGMHPGHRAIDPRLIYAAFVSTHPIPLRGSLQLLAASRIFPTRRPFLLWGQRGRAL